MNGDTEAISRWILKAEEDLQMAMLALQAEKPITGGSCFHSQQAAEKYLKALLVHVKIVFPPTHDLGNLVGLLAKRYPEAARLRTMADELTEYAVDVRYPDTFCLPTETDAQEAFAAAENIKSFCIVRLDRPA